MQWTPQGFTQNADWIYFSFKDYRKDTEKRKLRSLANKTGISQCILLVIFNLIATFLTLITIFFGAIDYGQTDMASAFPPDVYYTLSGLVSVVGMFTTALILRCMVGRRFDDLFSFHRTVSVQRIAALLPAGLAVAMFANYMVDYMLQNLSMIGIHYNLDAVSSVKLDNQWTTNILYILAVAVTPAFVEEFLYRGVLLGALRNYGDGFAVLTSSIIFGLIHGNLIQIPFAFIGGLTFAYITVYSGSIIPAMLLHFINNLFSVLGDIINSRFGQTAAEIYYAGFMGLFFLLGILGVALIAKRDGTLLTFKKYNYILTFREKMRCFFFSPGMIVFGILILLEVISFWMLM
ncbi:MAG TPA: CPBP family intramembrane metalloprotease [Candidatus Scatavimonas merdigallinarum]|mgnify:FL=1|uniref:CPBP family intramembrane metalloprotease n=1 Tax=Candidatus Scatavimonas merdigallinarum TaxID=2840914 RepID=A0A9D1CV76_9FIRM|nr:CPBP family intramembrane metalloprotease [Candidatus Scatavimonas merdigallinarum]